MAASPASTLFMNKLRNALIDKKINQTQLAAILEMKESYMSRIMNAHENITIELQWKIIVDGLGMTVGYFYNL